MSGSIDTSLEFPPFPKNFIDFEISPETLETSGDLWKTELILRNHSSCSVLYKVKCTSNERIEIEDCSDIIRSGNEIQIPISKKVKSDAKDKLLVLFCLVGKQWSTEDTSAYRCWERVKARDITTKSRVIRIVQKSEK